MIDRAITASVPFVWFAADEVCGDNGKLRPTGRTPGPLGAGPCPAATGYQPGPGTRFALPVDI